MSVERPAEAAESASAWAQRQVLSLIARAALTPGQQLPAERDLSLQLGVSRSSIREALSALSSLGVLDSRHGSGVFVTSLDASQLLSGLRLVLGVVDEDRVVDLVEVAGVLQVAAAGRAAARTDADLAGLAVLAAACRTAGSPGEAAECDRAFHDAVCRLSGNSMLAALADSVTPPGAREALWRELWRTGADDVHDEHDRLVLALGHRDAETARAVSTMHAFRSRILLGAVPSTVQKTAATATATVASVDSGRPTPEWYRDAKFGVLVHWGIYSVPGWAPLDESLVELLTDEEVGPHETDGPDPLVTHPFAEWYQNSAMLTDSPTWHYHRATYGRRQYADFRRPFETAVQAFDPTEWAALFAQAGARYVIPVAKHHDGYLLWPAGTVNPHLADWAAPRDVIGELAGAVRDRGMRMGVYYSSGIDWTFAHLPIRRMVDVRSSVPADPRYARYVDAHWRELIDRYEPSLLWGDMGYPPKGDAPGLFRAYYERVPDGLVTDRFGVGRHDVSTPNYARRHVIDAHVWEGVRPVGLSFGWNRQEDARHTLTGTQLVHLLVDVVSKNGNLLLGVAPDDRGRIPDLQARSLRELGDWLAGHGEAIYGTRPWVVAESSTQDGLPVRFTRRDEDLLVFLLGQPAGDVVVTGLHLPPSATLTDLRTGEPVEARAGRRGSVLRLPRPAAGPARVLRVSPCPPSPTVI